MIGVSVGITDIVVVAVDVARWVDTTRIVFNIRVRRKFLNMTKKILDTQYEYLGSAEGENF